MAEALQIFNIALTSTDATYSPGEKVTGAVVIQLRRAKCLKGLKLKVKGEAEVKWIVSTDDDGNVKLDQRNEEYFRSEFYLFGGAGNTNILELEEGPHLYPFKFFLPRDIPSTFAHKDGYVRYTIKAVWERPWSSDYTTSTTMTVEAPYDLSQEPEAMIGINDERNNGFCCFPFCIPMGSLSYNVSIPSSGFAAGETIRATISLNNGSSSVNVNAIQLQLTQRLCLYGKTEKRTHMITVHMVEMRGPFDKREDEIVVPMKIGSLPPTTFPHCSLIDIHYVLTVCICVSGCHCNPERTYPIYIGTKPPVDFQPVPVNAATHTLRPMQPDAPSAPFFEADDDTPCIVPVPAPARSVPPYLGHASTSTFEDPPPSYDECIASSRENLLPQKKQ